MITQQEIEEAVENIKQTIRDEFKLFGLPESEIEDSADNAGNDLRQKLIEYNETSDDDREEIRRLNQELDNGNKDLERSLWTDPKKTNENFKHISSFNKFKK